MFLLERPLSHYHNGLCSFSTPLSLSISLSETQFDPTFFLSHAVSVACV